MERRGGGRTRIAGGSSVTGGTSNPAQAELGRASRFGSEVSVGDPPPRFGNEVRVGRPAIELFPGAAAGLAAQVLAAAGLADEFALGHDEFAARVDIARIAAHFESFKHGVIDAHVVGCGGDGVTCEGVPENNVGVAARLQGRLSSDTCRRCAQARWRRVRRND